MPEKCFHENCLKTNNQGLYQLKVYLFCIPIDFICILKAFGHISGQISLTWPAEISYIFKTCGVALFKLVIFFLDFQKTKNMEPSEIKFWRAPCFLFSWNLNFLRHLNFVNISIFDTFRRLLRDIVACFCMLSYKCDTYLKR